MRELFNAGQINLYRHEKAVMQIKNLTVTYKPSGQWTVTGGKATGIDDLAFAMAGAILAASKDDDIGWIESLIS
jgi:hypothetical protein